MATTITKTIREDGTGDFTTAVAWEAAEQKDLVAADEIARGLIQNAWVSSEGEFVIQGWTTDATRFIILEAEGAARHTGKFTATAHRFLVVGNPVGFSTCRIEQGHVRLIGIQSTLKDVTAGSKTAFANIFTGDFVRLISCIGIVDNQLQICNNVLGILVKNFGVVNCLALNANPNASFRVRGFSWIDTAPVGQQVCYNCTSIDHKGVDANNYYMHKATEQVRVINCISKGSQSQGFREVFVSSFDTGSGFNTTDDSPIPPTAKGTGSRENQTFTFVNAAGGDFHLNPFDAGARGFATDTTALAVEPFSDDIDGDTRQALFDMGMDEALGDVSQVNVVASIEVLQNSEVQVSASIIVEQNGEVQAAASINASQNGEVNVAASIVVKQNGEVQVDASIVVKFQGEVQVDASVVVLQNGQVTVPVSIEVIQNGTVQAAASVQVLQNGIVPIIASIGVEQNGTVQVAASIAVDIGGRVQVDASINVSQNGEVEVVASIGVLLRIDGQVTADGSINVLQNSQVQVAASIQAVSLAAVIAPASIVVSQNAQVTVPVSINVLQAGGEVQIDASIGAKQNSQVVVAASIQAAVFTIVDGQVQVGASIQADFRVGLDDRSGAIERDYIPNSGRFITRNGILFIVDNETLIRNQKPPEGFGWDLDLITNPPGELLVDTTKPGSYPLQYKIDRDGGEFGMGVLRIEIPDDWIKT